MHDDLRKCRNITSLRYVCRKGIGRSLHDGKEHILVMKKYLLTKRVIYILCITAIVVLFFSGCGSREEGYVYYLNFKPEADAAFQELAREYTAQTGVPVNIVTAASNSNIS